MDEFQKDNNTILKNDKENNISRRTFIAGSAACIGSAVLLSSISQQPKQAFAQGSGFFSLPNGCNSQNWMKYIPGERYLNEINIPGTHDSATKNMAGGFPTWHWKCQDVLIKRQLELGVRFFDLRLAYEYYTDAHLVACHASGWCRTDENHWLSFKKHIIDVIEDFLKDNPSETVIIAPKHEHRRAGDYGQAMKEWWNAAKNKQGRNGDLFYYKNEMPKLKDVRGKIFILRRSSFATGGDWEKIGSDVGYKVEMDVAEIKSEKFRLENHWDNNTDDKTGCVRDYLNGTPDIRYSDKGNAYDSLLRICYTSSNRAFYPPKTVARLVNRVLHNYDWQKNKRYGWFLSDYVYEKTDENSEDEYYRLNPKKIFGTNAFEDTPQA